WGLELVALDDDHATLRDVRTGATGSVRARYVIGADGVHGPTRAALGIDASGADRLHESVSVLFRAPLWDVVGPHRYGIYWITPPDATGSLIPAGLGDRWIHAFEWDPTREQLDDYTPARITDRIRLATGVAHLEPKIESVGAVTFATKLADHFRAGR